MDIEWQWQQENARLRAALLFYANKQHYVRDQYSKSFVRTAAIDRDGGQIAREALEELNGGFNHGKHAAGE